MSTTKLHELLAVETNLETQAAKCRTDLTETFHKKRHLFEEKKLVFTPYEEGKPPQVEAQSEMASTVIKELHWVAGHLTKFLDASFQVADANTRAKADIVLDDNKFKFKFRLSPESSKPDRNENRPAQEQKTGIAGSTPAPRSILKPYAGVEQW